MALDWHQRMTQAKTGDGVWTLTVDRDGVLSVALEWHRRGSGRTARIWANSIAVRYGLPPFVRIKPQPDDVLFAGAAEMSMRGDHRATEAMFVSMLDDALQEATAGP